MEIQAHLLHQALDIQRWASSALSSSVPTFGEPTACWSNNVIDTSEPAAASAAVESAAPKTCVPPPKNLKSRTTIRQFS